MAKQISKVARVSDLPEINYLWDGMQTIVADDGSNYIINTSKLKGKKIVDIFGSMSTESGGKNIIYIRFDNGQTEKIVVYNGSEGDKGVTGGVGPQGDQGDAAIINYRERDDAGRGVVGVIYIVNNSTTDDPDSFWSSLMGKIMNESIYDINETFITEDEFNLLFNDVKYIYAEFVTNVDDKESILFNNDTNKHIVYRKYWTYEEGDTDVYYIKRKNGTYEAVNVSLWDDIYLGNNEGFFPITTSMDAEDIPIYYYDKQTNEYLEVDKVYNKGKVTITDEDGNTSTVEKDFYVGDKIIDKYYVPELDASLYSRYTIANGLWNFTLNTGKDLPFIMYQKFTSYETVAKKDDKGMPELDDDGNQVYERITIETYEPLYVYYDIRQEKYFISEYNGETNVELDTSIIQEFYQNTPDGYKLISNLNAYLVLPSERYYRRESDTNMYNEVVLTDIEANDDYIIASREIQTNTYIFERHWTEVIYDEIVPFTTTIEISNVDLYYSTTSEGPREYYKLVYTYSDALDEDGNPIEGQVVAKANYELIPVPSWIVAEFTTKDEDITALLLNANEDMGEEDNTEIDTTLEDLDTYVPSTPINRIVPGDNKALYRKEADGNYKLVNLDKDTIYEVGDYYSLNDEPDYVEITGENAIMNSIIELYEKTADNEYAIFTGEVINSNIYYYRKKAYTKVNDPETYLREYTLYLVYGEPKLLPIRIYPTSAVRETVTIEYDPEYIKFYEDGRIAAVTGDTIEDSLIYVRAGKNPETVYCIIHVNLLTPIKSISYDDENPNNVNIRETVDIKYTISPETTTNKNIIWSASKIVDEDDVEHDAVEIEQVDDSIVRIKGLYAGNVTISGMAADGQGTSTLFRLEVITPVTKFYWAQENIKYVPPVYYNINEIGLHNMQYPDDIWPLEENTVVKTEEYYYIDALHNKEYELRPVIEPDDVKYTSISWRSDNSLVAGVNRDNVLKGVELGETVIYGQLDKFPEVKEISLKVNVVKAITDITVTPSALSLNVNTKNKITATITPDDLVNASIRWSSTDENIVKILTDEIDPVNNIITIETVGIGNAQIIAQGYDGEEMSDKFASSEITVTIPTKDITVDGENVNDGIIYVGCELDENNTTTISAIITRDSNYDGSDVYKTGVIWKVNDESIATVNANDEKGLTATITGHNIGKTTIIANAADGSGVFGTIQVQVIKLTENISFDTSDFELDDSGKIKMNVGDSLVLVPSFTPESTNEIVIWKSSDTSIAKVKESGIVYALSAGDATITVTATDGSKKEATCEITIQ